FAAAGVVAALCALASLGVFASYSYALAGRLEQLQLGALALKNTGVSKVALAPATRPRLAQLLAPEAAAGQVLVEDLHLESTVTLGENVFESGSAVPTARAAQLLRAVA